MAAQYTEISLEDMSTFLKRGFRALHPKEGKDRGEVYFDLFLGASAGIRVWTSIGSGHGSAAGVGQDAIRVQLYNFAKGRPLIPGKAPIVKRTQGWRDSLKDRIEDYIEAYSSREEDIEAGKYIDWNKTACEGGCTSGDSCSGSCKTEGGCSCGGNCKKGGETCPCNTPTEVAPPVVAPVVIPEEYSYGR